MSEPKTESISNDKKKHLINKWLDVEEINPFERWLFNFVLILFIFSSFVLISLLVSSGCSGYGITFDKISLENSARFGDYFGGVIGSLWALTGVILFFLALKLQSKELKLQREQFLLSINEQKVASFENFFFNMLKNQQRILNDIKLPLTITNTTINEKTIEGKDFFTFTFEFLHRLYKYENNNNYSDFKDSLINIKVPGIPCTYVPSNIRAEEIYNSIPTAIDSEERILKVYEFFFEEFYHQVGHYFRHLYNMIRFLDSKANELEDPNHYAKIIQAQMSAPELFLTFYDGLYFPNMHKLLDKYDMMENLAIEDLLNISHQKYYKVRMKSRKMDKPKKLIIQLNEKIRDPFKKKVDA